ncbi:MAG: alpha/beta fold hydrolase [Acidimicrobiales bacterium]
MAEPVETTVNVGGVDVTVLRGGTGKPLLMLHDELGYPGWMPWNDELAKNYEFIIPLQPAYGKTPKVDWIMSYRDLGGFYAQMLRAMNVSGAVGMGFSGGAFAAAEMLAADPDVFSKVVLTGPMGLRPTEGEITDFLALTIRTHLRATVANWETPLFGKIYGGEMTPEQFEMFEDARTETSRIGWEPFMFNPSLPHLLGGITTPTLLVWGTADTYTPYGCIEAYRKAIPHAEVAEIEGAGHRPEIENTDKFVAAVTKFLG